MDRKKTTKKNDKITDWYDKIPKEFKTTVENDKNYKEHLIKPCSMIMIGGPTGSGKSNYLLEFLSRKKDSFYDIILFTGSFGDEPMYQYLKNKIPEMILIDDVDELPTLNDIKEIEFKERLLIFDDTLKLENNKIKEIKKFFMAARKKGFTVIYLTQSLSNKDGCSNFVKKQMKYLILFKFDSDMENTRRQIINKYSMDYNKSKIYEIYKTLNIGEFLTFDFREKKIRKNFLIEI